MAPDLELIQERVGETEALGEERCSRLRAFARQEYAEGSDNNIEVDPDAQCLEAGREGYWVEAWVYVDKGDLFRFKNWPKGKP